MPEQFHSVARPSTKFVSAALFSRQQSPKTEILSFHNLISLQKPEISFGSTLESTAKEFLNEPPWSRVFKNSFDVIKDGLNKVI